MTNIIHLDTRAPVITTRRPIYAGKVAPWGGVGTKIEANESIESAMARSNINFTAERTKEKWLHNGKIVTGDEFILKRSDTGAKLGNITSRYKPVQPIEVVDAWQSIVGVENWSLDVIGGIDGGKKIWALAKTDQEFQVASVGDIVQTYLLLTTGFDGGTSTSAKFINLRLVCLNGMTMSQVDSVVKIGHSKEFDVEEVKRQLDVAANATKRAKEEAETMADHTLTVDEATRFITYVLAGKEKADKKEISTKQQNIIDNVVTLYKGAGYGSQLESARGTVWGALNAITQHIDHNVGRNPNNRFREAMLGAGDRLKSKAYGLAMELCG